MRIHIRHEITQKLDPGTRNMAVTLRLTPRAHEGQYILRWALDLSSDTRLSPQEDAYGNLCHTFTLEGPAEKLVVVAEGEVETQDTTGIVRGTVERFPPSLFLRQTDLTEPTAAVAAFAAKIAGTPGDALALLHALMTTVHETVKENDTAPCAGDPLTADAALKAGKACPAGIAHVFTAAARHLGVPARHVSGYLAPDPDEEDGTGDGTARHWAEAFVPAIGWIAFDCGLKLCGTEQHVRLAVALDAVGVAPLRSTGLALEESVRASDGRIPLRQAQSQGQN